MAPSAKKPVRGWVVALVGQRIKKLSMKLQPRALQQSNVERVDALSVLPVFLDLHAKSVFVVGGQGPALWKAELIAKAGAVVTLVCAQESADVLQFVANMQVSTNIHLSISDWRACNFSGAAVIIADVGDDEAAEFFAAALKFTSLVNVIDKPAYCTFQFGSIVNKSPLVIGISSSGAAPVLAQHVRSLLETTLPARIQAQAQRAARIRTRVNARLGASSNRRIYWGAFFGKVFGFRLLSRTRFTETYVIKVADIDDLTLRDVRALQSADEIYFNVGTDPHILQFGRREALRFEVAGDAASRVNLDANSNVVFVAKP